DERSKIIEKNLRGIKGTEGLDKIHAEDNSLCLKCHLPRIGDPKADPHFPPTNAVGGVGCESCHGAASKWLEPPPPPGWKDKKKGLTAEQLDSQYNFKVLDNAPARVRACAGCHVGEPGREVNHDLIAAGHPRLNFELTAFEAAMPKHW